MGKKEKLILSALTVGAFVVGISSAQADTFKLDQITSPVIQTQEGSCGAGSCKSGSCGDKDECDPAKDKDCEKKKDKKSDSGSCGSGSCG